MTPRRVRNNQENLFHFGIDRRLGRVRRTRLAQVDGREVVGIYLLPAVDVIEQFARRTLRAHQGRLDLVLVEQTEQVFRFHQSGGGIVIDEELLAIEFGAAVDEGGDAVFD